MIIRNPKNIWIPKTGNMPVTKNVLFEKTTINKEGICLYVNGIKVYAFYNEEYLKKNKIVATKETVYNYNDTTSILFVNMPLEIITKESKILWRLSKFSFRAKMYKDSINNKIVINKI